MDSTYLPQESQPLELKLSPTVLDQQRRRGRRDLLFLPRRRTGRGPMRSSEGSRSSEVTFHERKRDRFGWVEELLLCWSFLYSGEGGWCDGWRGEWGERRAREVEGGGLLVVGRNLTTTPSPLTRVFSFSPTNPPRKRKKDRAREFHREREWYM